MSGGALSRLVNERIEWRQNHPYGFVAKPSKNVDGTLNLMKWDCIIPGKLKTPFETGMFRMRMTFNENYPNSPPKCRFNPPLFHPNVSSSGTVCIAILDQNKDWSSVLTIKDILLSIQNMMHSPDLSNPAQFEAYTLYRNNRLAYNSKVMREARITQLSFL